MRGAFRPGAVDRLGGRLRRSERPGLLVVRLMMISVLGWVLCGEALGEPPPTSDGLTLFEELVRNPNDVRANLAYARALEEDGRIEEARQIYQKVLLLDPNNPTAAAAFVSLTGAAPSAQTDYTFRTGGAI